MRYPKFAGNTIPEYALVGLVVIGGAMLALNLLGSNVKGQFSTLDQSIQTPETTSAATSVDAGSPMDTQARQVDPLLKEASYENIGQVILVAGANGATDELSAILQTYAERLTDTGELTKEQANWLSRLANEGYKLAAAERVLEDAVLHGKSTVQYEGRAYSVKEFSELFGFHRYYGVVASAGEMSTQRAMPLTVPFISIYQEAKERGAMANPAVARIVENLSVQITVASDLVKWNLDDVLRKSTAPEDYNKRLSMGFVTALQQMKLSDLSRVASSFTEDRSDKICRTGAGRVKNKECEQ